MRFFKRPPVPEVQVHVDPSASSADLDRAVKAKQDAERQAMAAQAAVAGLTRSRIRNGFAPAIEAGVLRKHLGGAT